MKDQVKKYSDWYRTWKCQKVSEEFIEKHIKYVSWLNVTRYQNLSEEFMDRHGDKLHWMNACSYQKLSVYFMDKWCTHLYWPTVSYKQILTPEFIDKHASRVSWGYVSQFQALTKALIDKYNYCVVWDKLSLNKVVDENVLDKYADKIDWAVVFLNRDISSDLVKKHFRRASFCSHTVSSMVRAKNSRIILKPPRKVGNQEVRQYIKNLLHSLNHNLPSGSISVGDFSRFLFGAYVNMDIHNNTDIIKDILAEFVSSITTCKEIVATNLFALAQNDLQKSGFLCGILFRSKKKDKKEVAKRVLRNVNKLLRRVAISLGVKAPKLYIQYIIKDGVYFISANLPPNSPWIRSKVMIHILAWVIQFGVRNVMAKMGWANTLNNLVEHTYLSGWKGGVGQDNLTWTQVRKLIRHGLDMKINACQHCGVVTGTRLAIGLGLLK